MQTNSPIIRFPGFKDSWNEQRLGKFFTSSRAKGSDGIPTLSVTLNRGLINRDEMDRKTETNLDADEHLLVREGDIAYNMMRMWQGAFGRSSCEGIVSPAYVVIRPLASADSGYFEYAFRRARSIYLFWAYSYGLTNDRLRLYGNDFLRIPFSAPSLPEQRKIADFLTVVDGRIQQLSQKKALLQDYKKGVMQQLFTQAIRFKDDQGNDFPEWEEKKLGEVITSLDAGISVNSDDSPATGKELGILKTSCVTTGQFDPTENKRVTAPDELGRLKEPVTAGTIVISRMNTKALVGLSGLVPQDHPNLFLPDRLWAAKIAKSCSAEWAAQLLRSTRMRALISAKATGTSGSMKNITKGDVLSLPAELPCLPEQTKIANFLTALDRKIESVSHQITHTQTFKKGLLQQMFV